MQVSSAVTKQISTALCALFVVCAVELVAQGRDWYWYRVTVTTVGDNQYEDGESGVTIVTDDSSEVAKGIHARLMISAKDASGWIAFDGGESCEVTGLIHYEDEGDSQETNDSDDDPPDETNNVFA